MEALTGITCAPISQFEDALSDQLETVPVRLVREADEALTVRLDGLRAAAGVDPRSEAVADEQFEVILSEARMIKDSFELDELRQACAHSAVGFTAVVADLPQAVRRGRGERWVEGIFGLHARHLGNAVGYDTIAAAGDDANTLHWMRNDGELREGELLLLDAGVEVDSLYTADITRTLPVSGTFSPTQRQVYTAVLEAQANRLGRRPAAAAAGAEPLLGQVHADALILAIGAGVAGEGEHGPHQGAAAQIRGPMGHPGRAARQQRGEQGGKQPDGPRRPEAGAADRGRRRGGHGDRGGALRPRRRRRRGRRPGWRRCAGRRAGCRIRGAP